MKYFILLTVVVFIVIAGYILDSSKSNGLAEGFQNQVHHQVYDHGQRNDQRHGSSHGNVWHRNNYNPPVFFGNYGPSTYGGRNSFGYFPIYTEYEYPVYYVDNRNNFISDERGILYYLFNPYALFARIFS
jgi:hypothetical protein